MMRKIIITIILMALWIMPAMAESVWKVAPGRSSLKFRVSHLIFSNVEGKFKDFEGKIGETDEERGKVKVLVSMFGRETPVELDYLQVAKI